MMGFVTGVVLGGMFLGGSNSSKEEASPLGNLFFITVIDHDYVSVGWDENAWKPGRKYSFPISRIKNLEPPSVSPEGFTRISLYSGEGVVIPGTQEECLAALDRIVRKARE